MNAERRSQLFRIVFLCYAVLFGQTAHAAQPSRRIFSPGSLPCQVKLLVAQPEPRQQIVRQSAQPLPPRPVAHRAHFPMLNETGVRVLAATELARQAFHIQHAIYVAPQLRPFSLRI